MARRAVPNSQSISDRIFIAENMLIEPGNISEVEAGEPRPFRRHKHLEIDEFCPRRVSKTPGTNQPKSIPQRAVSGNHLPSPHNQQPPAKTRRILNEPTVCFYSCLLHGSYY